MLDFKEPLLSVFHVLKKPSWSKLTSCYGNMAVVVGFNNEKWSNFVHLRKLLKHQLLCMLRLSVNTICTQSVTPRSPNQHCSGCAEHLWAWSQSSPDTTLTDSSKQCHPARQLPYMSQNPSIVKAKPIRVHSQSLEDMTKKNMHKKFGPPHNSSLKSCKTPPRLKTSLPSIMYKYLFLIFESMNEFFYMSSNFLRALKANV